MHLTIRPVDDGEFDHWYQTENAVFGGPTFSPERAAAERSVLPLDRTVAAFDGDTLVGTSGAFPFDMTVPGGDTLPVAGVTAVTVVPTHRRRGVLREMMAFQLDDVVARDEPMAILNASESGIYGRYGYGIAQLFQEYQIDVRRSAFRDPVPERSAPLRWLSKAEARRALPPVYEQCRRLRPGMLSQSDPWWGCVLAEPLTWKGGGEDMYIVIADADDERGTGPGFAIYRLTAGMTGGNWTLRVFALEATDPIVEAQLWRFLLDVDLVGTVEAEYRPLDCNLRWLFAEPRQVRVTRVSDFLWLRPLDIERCLSAREYTVDDELTFAVSDPFRPANDGSYVVRKGRCERTDSDADLDVGVDDLGAFYLGQTKPSALAAARRITERTPGALARADALFAWPVAPGCITRF